MSKFRVVIIISLVVERKIHLRGVNGKKTRIKKLLFFFQGVRNISFYFYFLVTSILIKKKKFKMNLAAENFNTYFSKELLPPNHFLLISKHLFQRILNNDP